VKINCKNQKFALPITLMMLSGNHYCGFVLSTPWWALLSLWCDKSCIQLGQCVVMVKCFVLMCKSLYWCYTLYVPWNNIIAITCMYCMLYVSHIFVYHVDDQDCGRVVHMLYSKCRCLVSMVSMVMNAFTIVMTLQGNYIKQALYFNFL